MPSDAHVITNAPIHAVLRALAHLHPLGDDDEGHFICTLALRDGRTHSVHGVLSAGILPHLQERVGVPAFAQLTAMVECADSGQKMAPAHQADVLVSKVS